MSVHGFIRTYPAMRALTYLNEHILRAADVVVATSTREADRLVSNGYHRVHFVANGVRLSPCTGEHPDETESADLVNERRVVFVGRLSPEKRPDLFLRMSQILATAHPHITFLVVGGGPLREELERMTRQCGLAGRVRFTGVRHDVDRLVRGAEVLVCPSDTEGTPRAVIEAMVHAVPIVATDVGGLPDLITNQVTGVLVQPGSSAVLARAVGDLLTNPLLARSLAEAGAEHARHFFAVDRMAVAVARVYSEASQVAQEVSA